MAIALSWCANPSQAAVVVFPKPPEEVSSPDYRVSVTRVQSPAGEPTAVPVYGSFRYDGTSKSTLWGRPVSPISFCSIDADEEIEITVRLEKPLAEAGIDTGKVIVRPLALGLRPQVSGGAIRLRIKRSPCQLTIEPGGGLLRPLHIFINPIETERPRPDDPNVIYFGPGYHEIDGIRVKDGQTVYVAGGAVLELKPRPEAERGTSQGELYGLPTYAGGLLIDAGERKNVTIRGRGVLSCRKALQLGQRGNFIALGWVQNVRLEGLILRESGGCGPHVMNGDHVRIDNVKVLCPYVNGDGIVMGGTSHAIVENCFSHNADDSLEVKVWREQHDVEFRNCTVWNDIGGSFGLMHESGALSSNIAFRNCTVIHSTDDSAAAPVVGIKLDEAGPTRQYVFENIVIEHVASHRRPALKVFNNWSGWTLNPKDDPAHPYQIGDGRPHTPPRGPISDVTFRNISVLDAANRDIVLMADGPASPISDVKIENVVINKRKITAGDARLKTNEWVTGVQVR